MHLMARDRWLGHRGHPRGHSGNHTGGSREPLQKPRPVSHIRSCPVSSPFSVLELAGRVTVRHPNRQRLGDAHAEGGARSPERGGVPRWVSGTRACSYGGTEASSLSCEPRRHGDRRGASLRVDNRENQKPIMFLLSIIII